MITNEYKNCLDISRTNTHTNTPRFFDRGGKDNLLLIGSDRGSSKTRPSSALSDSWSDELESRIWKFTMNLWEQLQSILLKILNFIEIFLSAKFYGM